MAAHAQESETLLRPRRSALCHLQLLSSVAAAENDSRTLQVFAGGLCSHARSLAPADQRATEIDTFGDAEGAQAASFARFALEKNASRQRAVTVAFHERWFGIAAFLATTLLWLQRVQQLQSTRKIGVHACQSREARFGEESRRMDVE